MLEHETSIHPAPNESSKENGGSHKESPKDSTEGRPACSECQRRKQKCNREWPCNHCQKRRVADKCQFKTIPVLDTPQQNIGKKRERDAELGDQDYAEAVLPEIDSQDIEGFEALGYAASHMFTAGLNSEINQTKPKASQKQYFLEAKTCPQLERALQILPPRPYTDAIVSNFVDSVNYHYYIIYPQSFLKEYEEWWKERTAGRPLGLQWTCLLLMICACSVQYASTDLENRLREDFGENPQKLGEQYHTAARELHSVIPVGHSHLLNVQQLLHSCYWYKSAARFVECWHVLNSAIREAQELGMHQESSTGDIPELEQEIRKRVWCVLHTWDWQISALLSRPMIIDRSDCDVGPPGLTLEGYSPSPLLHMKLQSELITKLAGRFILPKLVVTPTDVQEYQGMMEEWMASFPPTYSFQNTDRSQDEARPWIQMHRHYLHTMACSMVLDPIRSYLAKDVDESTPEVELQIRRDGVGYALKLMKSLQGFFDFIWPREVGFHFLIFCIFDTAAVFCSVILHDEPANVPRLDEMTAGLSSALKMLDHLIAHIEPAQLYHDILTRLQRKVHKKLGILDSTNDTRRKRVKAPLKSRVTEVASEPSPPREEPPVAVTLPVMSPITFTPFDQHATQTPPNEPEISSMPPPLPSNPILSEVAYNYDQFPANGFPLDNSLAYAASGPINNGWMPEELPSAMYNGMPLLDEQVTDWGFSHMTNAELGELGDLWRWESLDLGLIGQAPPPPPQ